MISLLGSADLCDVTALRKLYDQDNKFTHEGITILCGESHRTTPELVVFTLRFPLSLFAAAPEDAASGIPFADFCLRAFIRQLEDIDLQQEHQTGKVKYTGKIYIHKPNQLVLLRNTAYVEGDSLNIMLRIQFPVYMMQKRNVVAGKLSVRIVKKHLARAIRDFLSSFDEAGCCQAILLYRRQQEIRRLIGEKGLVCFVADGTLLPRAQSGGPLPGAVPFSAPPEDAVTLCLSDGFTLEGLGIKKGVTVITGGGYSGKSTLLDGILEGVYNHIPGDGREYCVTQTNSCKIVAEEGRNINALDISPFMRHINNNQTTCFTTAHASGSTSQAANIMEAVSFGCRLLLIDEDRTATNFMIRDARMKSIIKHDPIVPFTDRVREIYDKTGTSTILVIGGSSEYLDLADTVFMMNDFILTNFNGEINRTRQHDFGFFAAEDAAPVRWLLPRQVVKSSLNSFRKDPDTGRIREHIAADMKTVEIGELTANVSHLTTLLTLPQKTAIAYLIRGLCHSQSEPAVDLFRLAAGFYEKVLSQGLGSVHSSSFPVEPDLELPLLSDLLFALSRISKIEYL